MSLSFNGTSQYADVASSPVASGSCTISAWVNPTSTTGGCVASIGRSANYDGYVLSLDSVRRPFIEVLGSAGGTDQQATHATACATGSWSHVAGTTSGAQHISYKDGVAGTPNNTSSTPASCDHVSTGANWNWGGVVGGSYLNGSTAEIAIWNIVLNSTEIGQLAAGAMASSVQPGNLVFYARMRDASSPSVDLISARNLTWQGSPTFNASNPTITGDSIPDVVMAPMVV